MTATTETTGLLKGKAILAEHRDEMVALMGQFPSVAKGVDGEAELAIDQLFDRLTYRLMHEKGRTHGQAELAIDAGIQFLARVGTGKCAGVPTDLEDEGWHTFLPYTPEYKVFCQVVCGRFVHHRPNDIIGAMTHCQHEGGHPEAEGCERSHLRGYCASCDI